MIRIAALLAIINCTLAAQATLLEEAFSSGAASSAWQTTAGVHNRNPALLLNSSGDHLTTRDATYGDIRLSFDYFSWTNPSSATLWVRSPSASSPSTEGVRVIFSPSGGSVEVSHHAQGGGSTLIARVNAPFFPGQRQTFDLRIVHNRVKIEVNGFAILPWTTSSVALPPEGAVSFERRAGSWDVDNIVIDRSSDTARAWAVEGANGFTLDMSTNTSNALLFVVSNTVLAPVPLAPYGTTQVSLGPGLFAWSDPLSVLGTTISGVTSTDEYGDWSISFPTNVWGLIYGFSPRDVHFEVFAIDLAAPTGLFWQSPVETYRLPY